MVAGEVGRASERAIARTSRSKIAGGVRGDNWSEGRLRCSWPEISTGKCGAFHQERQIQSLVWCGLTRFKFPANRSQRPHVQNRHEGHPKSVQRLISGPAEAVCTCGSIVREERIRRSSGSPVQRSGRGKRERKDKEKEEKANSKAPAEKTPRTLQRQRSTSKTSGSHCEPELQGRPDRGVGIDAITGS